MNPNRPLRVTDDDAQRRLEDLFKPIESAEPAPHGRAPAAVRAAPIDELFPGYSDVREVARGTYVGRPRDGGAIVVLRILPVRSFGDVRHIQRYSSNIDLAVQLREPGIVPVLARGTAEDGRPYLIREHVNGVPLDVYARGDSFGHAAPPPLPALVRIFARVCSSLHLAHLAGVLHGGIKAGNVIIDSAGTVQLLDFGLNLAAGGDVHDDLAALGKLFFDTLRSRPVPPDAGLRAIVSRVMSRDPQTGYSSAQALAEDLEHYLTGEPITGQPLGIHVGLLRWLDRHVSAPRPVLIVGGIAGVVAGTYLGVPATRAMVVAVGELAGGSPWAHVIDSARELGWFGRVWILAAVVLTFAMGAIASRLAKPRTRTGFVVTGLVTGLAAGVAAWLIGAGGFIGTAINLGSAREAQALAAAFPSREPFAAASSFDVEGSHPQDRLLDVHPDLKALPEDSRSSAIHARLLSDLCAGAYIAGWLGPLAPIGLGASLSVLGALAYASATRNRLPWLGRALTYLELSVPGQMGLVMLTAVAIGLGGGFATRTAWMVPPALLALASVIALAIRNEVPMAVRITCYLGAFALYLHWAGESLSFWMTIPIGLAGVAAIGWLYFMGHRPKDSVFE